MFWGRVGFLLNSSSSSDKSLNINSYFKERKRIPFGRMCWVNRVLYSFNLLYQKLLSLRLHKCAGAVEYTDYISAEE